MHRRIVVLVVLAAVLATSLFGIPLAIGAARYYQSDEFTELERLADHAAVDAAADLVRGRDPGELPAAQRGTTLGLYDPHGMLISGSGPRGAGTVVGAALRDGSVHSQSVAGSLVVAVPVADTVHVAGVVRASTSQSEVYPRIALTWLAMLLLGAVAVGLTWLAARRYARRLARPLERLARSATTLGEGDFSVRTEPSGIGEIDAASGALNQTAERIGELVDRERAFTADASHQLRTPLTGLRLGLESGLEASPALYRAVIETAIGQADRLEGTIDDLLALARDVRQHEVVHIAPIVRQMREHWHGTLAARGRRFTLAIDEGLPVTRVSTAALRQVLAVLVDNAIVHGEGTVDVHARDAGGALAIDVRDEGSSITVEETTLFRRRVSSADQGHGIGLALARSLAEAEGGRLQLAGRNPSTFSLLLPATESD